ncbi:MAG: polyprenyl synthetase [Flavobacteriaceae bacterium TMED212]|nr:MAG: polyprenyl synthetase [Flavobacteriaceae bacterium TMED212]
MDLFKAYQEEFQSALENFNQDKFPQNLYIPIQYLMELGGKRIRPFLTLMAGEVFGVTVKDAMGAAMAVEVFHNFTLMHDDIMDSAALRRGKTTVHEKWDVNTAILSGDAMLIKAYQALESYPTDVFQKLTRLFSKTALEVCEGQQYDMDFETNSSVSHEEYIEMIRLKTGVLVGCALQMGAIIAKASDLDQKAIYDFGIQLGLAFQLQDDYLDTFGDQASFGKKIGGDILEDKKTILYHLALKVADKEQANELQSLLGADNLFKGEEKINKVKTIFEATSAKSSTRDLIQYHSKLANIELEKLSINEDQKSSFRNLKNWMMYRTY